MISISMHRNLNQLLHLPILRWNRHQCHHMSSSWLRSAHSGLQRSTHCKQAVQQHMRLGASHIPPLVCSSAAWLGCLLVNHLSISSWRPWQHQQPHLAAGAVMCMVCTPHSMHSAPVTCNNYKCSLMRRRRTSCSLGSLRGIPTSHHRAACTRKGPSVLSPCSSSFARPSHVSA